LNEIIKNGLSKATLRRRGIIKNNLSMSREAKDRFRILFSNIADGLSKNDNNAS
jgi:hypothetical protein